MTDYSERLAKLSPTKRALLLEKLQGKASKQTQGIPRRDDPTSYPLSYAQQRLWLVEQLQPNAALYNIAVPLHIQGLYPDLITMLNTCLSAIIQRHAPLRALFTAVDGIPTQTIRPAEPLQLAMLDLREQPSSQREAELSQILQRETERPFHLGQDALFRALLIRVAPDEHVLLLVIHHLVFDAWSMGILVRELETLFAALEQDRPLGALPPLAIEYADFAAWQREWLQGETLQQQLDYWQNRLQGELPVLALPTDRPRPPVQTFRGGRYAFWIGAEQVGTLHQLSQHHNVTLFMTLLAAWATLLHRYSGQIDLLIGSPIANRQRREVEDLIGFFVNTLVFRINVADDPPFVALLQHVRDVALGAYTHQDLPFEMLVDALQPTRDLSRSPLFQVMFVLQNAPVSGTHDAFNILEDVVTPAKFDLTLSFIEYEQGLRGILEYNCDLFDERTIERLSRHFATVLEQVCHAPDLPLSHLRLLEAQEQQHILTTWNATTRSFPQHCFHQLFEQQATRTPTAVAVVAQDQTITYRALNERANQLAYRLRQQGVAPETLVGICVDRSIDMIVALLAVLKAGGGYVPLDPAYPPERLSWMIADAQIHVLLTQQALLPNVRAVSPAQVAVVPLETICNGQEPIENDSSAMAPQQVAYVIYTSGSTGQPKGVVITHEGLCNVVTAQIAGFHVVPESRVVQFASFSFDAAISEIGMALLSGATLYMLPARGLLTGDGLLAFLRQHAITTATLPPSLLAVMTPDHLPDLATIIAAGEPSTVDIVQRWGDKRRFINAYGPTEASICASLTTDQLPLDCAPSIGYPIANMRMHILDAHLRPVPIGVIGEIYLGGIGLARGYLHRPALTAERFIPDPFATQQGQRLYRTGDLGRYRSDGTVECLGRTDDQVKVRGFRIELGEIIAALNHHPGVQQSTVVMHERATNDRHLVAYVVPDAATALPVRNLLTMQQNQQVGDQDIYKLPNGMVVIHEDAHLTTAIYREIFEDEAYIHHDISLTDGACVIDVGANIGMFCLFVGQQHPNVRLFAIEPIPATVQLLRQNLALYGLNATILECGLADQNTEETFTYYPHFSFTSGRFADAKTDQDVIRAFDRNLRREQGLETSANADIEQWIEGRWQSQQIVCQLRTLSDILREQAIDQVDLLKIDAERSELDILAGIAADDWHKIRQIVIEVRSTELRDRVLQELQFRGYTVQTRQAYQFSDTSHSNIFAVRQDIPAAVTTELVRDRPTWNNAGQLVADLQQWLRTRLPESMIPSAIMLLPQLPLTANGKLDRQALPSLERALLMSTTAKPYVAPRNEIEEIVAEVWSDILHTTPVGIDDNFFDLGGNSLAMVQVHSRLQSLLADDIDLLTLFKYPTIQTLAHHLTSMTPTHTSLFADRDDRAQQQRSAFQRHRWQKQR